MRCSKRVLEKLQIANLRQKRRASSEVSLLGGGGVSLSVGIPQLV